MKNLIVLSILSVILAFTDMYPTYAQISCCSDLTIFAPGGNPCGGEEVEIASVNTCQGSHLWNISGGHAYITSDGPDAVEIILVDYNTTYSIYQFWEGSGCDDSYSNTVYVTTASIPSKPNKPSGNTNPLTNTNQTYTTPAVQGATDYDWEISGGAYIVVSGEDTRSITIKFTSSFTDYDIKVRAGISDCVDSQSAYSQVLDVRTIM